MGRRVFGPLLDILPTTDARDLANIIETIQANLGLHELLALKELSLGVLFGTLSDKELESLRATLANLDTKQKPETLRKNLRKVLTHYKNLRNLIINERGQELMEQGMTEEQAFEQLLTESFQ